MSKLRHVINAHRGIRITVAIITVVAIGYILFQVIPSNTELKAGHIVTLITSSIVWIYFLRNKIAEGIEYIIKDYNVAEVKLRGPIKEQKDGFGDESIASENVVKRVRKLGKLDYDAVIVNINTPGGAPVPSEDIRRELDNLDIPVYTYTRSLCASGGYMIACGSDWIHARQDSLVGSIGVIGSQHKLSRFGEKYGIDYERFVGGEHKDTHRPFHEPSDEERDYWQSVIDASYENFVNLVAEERNLSVEEVKDTKAEVLDAGSALETGLVDSIGSKEVLKEKIRYHNCLDELNIRQYSGGSVVFTGIDVVVSTMAYSFGKGLASVFRKSSEKKIEYRM